MLKTKDDLANYLNGIIIRKINKREDNKFIIMQLNRDRGISIDILSDIFALRMPLNSYSTFVLYCILDALKPDMAPVYFSEKEIKAFADERVDEATKNIFPIEISDVIKISDDQFLTKLSVKDIIKLRDSQLINYNENTQRAMKHIVRGNVEIYKVSLNKRQVEEIEKSFTNNIYIPNTITLNMPEDCDYKYNEKSHEMIIKSISAFDILDGYHRYIAISNLNNKGLDIDYTMEARICIFSEEKAKQFIWQEDQKTQMKKIVSDTFNQSSNGNQIVNGLNVGMYAGLIKIDGIIDAALLARTIDTVFYHRLNPNKSRVIMDKNNIKAKLDEFINMRPEYLEKKWNRDNIIYFTLYAHDEISLEKFIETLSLPPIVNVIEINIKTVNKLRKEVL